MPDNTTTLPVGTILSFGGTPDRIPSGYLPCDGSSVSQAQYQALFSAIGYSWGGTGSPGQFNLPDLRGIFLRGADMEAGNDPDAGTRYLQGNPSQTDTGVGSWQNGDVQNHQHTWNHFFFLIGDGGNDIGVAQPENSGNLQNNSGPITITDGGNPGHETRPINAAVTYIIYAGA